MDKLGSMQLLSHLDPGTSDEMVHRLGRLAVQEPILYEALECYLNLAGGAQATVAALGVHRSTPYSGLRHIEDLTGTSLADDLDRL
jgi:sugar diacid utilization regulator